MRIKITFLAAFFTLLIGFQAAQAQRTQQPSDRRQRSQQSDRRSNSRPNFVVMGVQGTITITVPLYQNVSGFKCSDIVVQLGQDKPSSPLNISTFEALAITNATGDITTGKCGYIIPNNSGVPVKTYKIGLGTLKNLPGCDSIKVIADNKPVTFPTANKVETINFDGKPLCVQIK
jgi:hypothetical protein